ncbi:lysophospholipid acyltransferase family protein [Abyssalbus ytuae]|uniref:Lysophospholipid acyltransferase family protein n=1 Tax=Abyssalbus ytuae TaxID=2926907 RepID=A0A9E6ZN93_9FLAO|nr:lysophospholipid acyltransferase family protein [Abyssalbus ytuae]UOB17430.1 lysophospholipid acyltransferase family protein [Abyssalbus ytuae]
MQLVVYLIVFPFLWAISILPFKLFYLFSDFVYLIVYRLLGYRKKVVRNNLKLVFPEKSLQEIKHIEKKFYRHMCDLFLEMIKSLTISEKEIKKRFTLTNPEVLKKYGKQGKSSILICGHYASYEWATSLGYHIEHTGYAIYTPLANKYFDRLVKKIRMKHNAYLISRYDAVMEIKKHQDEKHLAMYGFASDQSPQLGKSHYWREFMGVKVPVFTGAEFLAKKLGLPVVFMDIQKIKRGYYQATFTTIADTPKEYPDYQITDIFTQMLEEQIRKKPEYYLWTHKRWKHKDKVPEKYKG